MRLTLSIAVFALSLYLGLSFVGGKAQADPSGVLEPSPKVVRNFEEIKDILPGWRGPCPVVTEVETGDRTGVTGEKILCIDNIKAAWLGIAKNSVSGGRDIHSLDELGNNQITRCPLTGQRYQFDWSRAKIGCRDCGHQLS